MKEFFCTVLVIVFILAFVVGAVAFSGLVVWGLINLILNLLGIAFYFKYSYALAVVLITIVLKVLF